VSLIFFVRRVFFVPPRAGPGPYDAETPVAALTDAQHEPLVVMGGNIMEANKRAPSAKWVHSAINIAAIVRNFSHGATSQPPWSFAPGGRCAPRRSR
jgi:hypothetical protein